MPSHIWGMPLCRGAVEVGCLVASSCSSLKKICFRTNGVCTAHWYAPLSSDWGHVQSRSGRKIVCDMVLFNNRSSFVCWYDYLLTVLSIAMADFVTLRKKLAGLYNTLLSVLPTFCFISFVIFVYKHVAISLFWQFGAHTLIMNL